jgi:hypothetical protein
MQIALEPNKVYTFKLNSGEEMIAKVEQAGGDWIIITEPVSVAPGPQGLGLVPSMFTADVQQEIRLNTASIALCARTDDSVCMKYLEATTGIKVPDKKLILG